MARLDLTPVQGTVGLAVVLVLLLVVTPVLLLAVYAPRLPADPDRRDTPG